MAIKRWVKVYDSRLQPKNRFPPTLEYMSHAAAAMLVVWLPLVQRVISQAPAGTQVIPAIAGVWGNSIVIAPRSTVKGNQPSCKFEEVSHFSFLFPRTSVRQ